MYCKNCGSEIKSEEKFCSKCGAATVQKTSESATVNRDEIIKRIDCGNSGITKMISMIIIGVFFAVDAVIYMDSGDDTIELMGKLFLVLAIAVAACGPIMYMNYQKRFCLIKKDGISGVTCGTTDFTNSPFEFKYSEVISVQKKKFASQVIVQTANKKIGIFLPGKEIKTVYEHINSEINKK